ncbi:autotransporter-associated beta strand repeat-containing protein [Ereboglobus luteus]|uniref:autotransporter-associated beta strand repeat-containing protein n=1 Tax=Ereboglobus luteus TaxID=1796921 RepID=UPI001374A373|nr:autotransporter-associated beta strand repeat-containing protein [Ereboglobus luteus]
MEAQSTWQTTGNGAWGAAANWNNGVPNAADATAIISNDLSAGNHTITIANPGVIVGTLSIEGNNATASTIIIQSSTLGFEATGGQNAVLNYQGSNYITISSVINLLSDFTIQAGTDPLLPAFASKLTISGRIDGNGNTLYVNAGHAPATTTISGAITGAGTQLIKTGGGALVLSNSNNTFSGGLDVFVGAVTTTIGNRANAGTVLGAGVAATGANYLGIGDIKVANSDALLTINSAANNYAGQHVTLGGGLILLENGGGLRISENDARTTFRFNFNSGTLSGGTNPNHGTLTLAGADFVYNADGSGGTLFENAPTLVFDTSRNATAMNVKMNNTAMLGAFGVVRKTGTNALTFTAGDTGAFRADEFVIESGLGAVTLNQTALDLANGLTFSGTNARFTNLLTLPTGSVSFGRADQLSNSSALNIGQNVITNLLLNGYDQTFSSINIATDARLGIWMSASTPSTLTIGGLTSSVATPTTNPQGANYLSIYNWKGNPNTHLLDGTVVSNGNIVKAIGGVDLSKVWFRGYAPGATLDASGNLVPVDFLRTTLNSSGSWFNFAAWSVDIANGAGSEVTLAATAPNGAINLQNQAVTIGHFITDKNLAYNSISFNITTGALVFDSGVMESGSKAPSTISGTGGLNINAGVVLNNNLILLATGKNSQPGNSSNGIGFGTSVISGSGRLIVQGAGMSISAATARPNFNGGIDLHSTLSFDHPGNTNTALTLGTGTLTLYQGAVMRNYAGSQSASLDNPLVIAGNFAIQNVHFTGIGNTELDADRTIAVSGGSSFRSGVNLVGAGKLTLNIAGSLGLYSDGNVFSGGLVKTGAGSLNVYLHNDLVTGTLAPGSNYLGSGSMALNAGSITVTGSVNDLGDALYSATLDGALYTAGKTTMTFNLVDTTISEGTEWTIGTAATHYLNLYANRNLTINESFLTGFVNLYANPGAGITQTISSTMSNGFTGIGTLTKQGVGTTILSSTAGITTLSITNGTFIIDGDNYIKPRAGVNQPALTMSGGLLQTTTGTNSFNALSVTGNTGFMLSNHSSLLFNGVGTWATTGNTYQLSLANDSGIWSTAAKPTEYDTYVYITNSGTAAFASRLSLIAFTGYEQGAEFVQSGTLWFIAPSGQQLGEWAGAADGSNGDTDRLWSSGSNWINGVPNASGRVAAVRDLDSMLNNNIITVDMDATVGKLLLESAGAQYFTLDSTAAGTLVFDNSASGTSAFLINQGVHSATIRTNMRLDSDLEIKTTSANRLIMTGYITGTGAIIYNTPYAGGNQGVTTFGTVENSGSSASDYTGGFWMLGSTQTSRGAAANTRYVLVASHGSVFGTGSLFGDGGDASKNLQALNIGDGTAGRWYYLRSATTNVAHTVDASVRIAGNLNFGADNYTDYYTLTIQSDAPSYVASGTWVLYGYNYFPGNARLILKTDLQGPGGFDLQDTRRDGNSNSSCTTAFYGDNTFTGGVIIRAGVGVGSDTAFGTGTVSILGTTDFWALGGNRTISNNLVFNSSGEILWRTSNFTLDYSGTSTLVQTAKMYPKSGVTVIVPASHTFAGAGGLAINEQGTIRLEGAHEYTGNTSISNGTLSVGDNLSIGGSGTLIFGGASAGTLASYGDAITLSNDVLFTGAYIGLNGNAGLLTLDPSLGVTLNNNKTIAVTGTAVFGANLAINGDYGINKTFAGTLVINSGNSTYTGNTAITQGTLRVNAAGDITLGEADAGNNYLGTGHVTFTSGNFARLLELVTTDGSSVNLHGNLALTGNSAVNTASINITDTAGAISGANIDTKIVTETNSTISGNAYGYLRTAGDIIKTGTATLHWTGGNIVTPNFILREGALDLGSANSTRTGLGSFTLGTATFNVSGSQTFAGTLFNLAGSGTINMNGASGSSLLTFQNLGSWNGTLDIINWNGNSTYGGGATQVRFVSDVLNAFDYARLAAISFYSSGVITYAPGAKILKNPQQFYEIIPLGVSAEWVGDASGNNWGNTANWKGNISPTGPGAVAVFSNTLQLGGDPVHIDVANLKLGGLMFTNNTGENYSLDGQSITFEQMDSDEVANLTLQNNNSVTIANAGIALSNRLVVSTVGSGTLTINAPVSGTQGMIKSGAGELVLASNAGSFSGGITLLDGTLTAAASSSVSSGSVIAGPLGTGTLTVAGTLAPTLAFAAAGAQTIDNAINLDTQLDGTDAVDITLKLDAASGNETTLTSGIAQSGSGVASLEKTGDGALTLAAASAHTGTTTVSAGTLAFTAANAIASSTAVIVNATLATGDIKQTLTNLSGTGHIIAGADGNNLTGHVIALNTAATTYSGSITGDGALTKTGTGTLTLGGVNTHTGSTTIHEGTLVAATAGGDSARALGSGTIFYTNALGSTLRLEGSGTLSQGQHVAAGASGTVQVANGGTLGITASKSPALFVGENGAFTSVGNITFLDNHVSGRNGAAVYTGDGASLSFNSGTATFASGSVSGVAFGGAIYSEGSLDIASSQSELIFQDNQAHRGSAIYTEGSVSIDTDGSSLLFVSNTARDPASPIHPYTNGGAMRALGGLSINMTGGGTLALLDNYASSFGGAIASGTTAGGGHIGDVSITGDYGRIEMSGNIAFNGSAGAIWSAGSIAISATSAALMVTSNTSAKGNSGGAFHASDGDIIISGSYGIIEIAGNVIADTNWRGGGAFHAFAGDIVINPAATGTLSIAGNSSSANGGAFYTEAGDIVISGSYGEMFITSNVASESGGAFYAEEGNIVIGGTHGGIFIESNTATDGGAFYTLDGSVRFSATASGDLRITDNYADNAGGAIVAYGDVVMGGAYDSILINSNTAQGFASAIYTYGGSVAISATTSGSLEIANNSALGGRSAIYAGEGFSITGDYDVISITGNTASAYSGVVYTTKNIVITPGAVETLVIASNTASSGGAFYSTGTTIIGGGVENISIAGNTVDSRGGAIYGGDIVISPDAAETLVVTSNTAVRGGAFYSVRSTTIGGVENMSVANNTADARGGAFYSGSNFTLTVADGAVFTATNNKAADDASGGFLYTAGGSMLFDIGAGATATIGDANSISAVTDSIAAATDVSLTKTGAGALTLWARNTYTGTTFVSGGVLNITGWTGSTAGVVIGAAAADSGTINVSGYLGSTGTITVGGAGAGALSISGSGFATAAGVYSQNARSTLTLDASARGTGDAFVYASSATVGGTISVSGFTTGTAFSTASAVLAEGKQVLISATSGTIAGVFASATLAGFDGAGLPDYLYGGVYKNGAATQYLAGVNLSWLGGAADGHGDFTIASGTGFNVDVSLANQNNGPYASGWDGKTLTLTTGNSGTLVLSASNSFSGNIYLRNGTLVAAAAGGNTALALGSGTIVYTNPLGSTLRFAGTGTLNQTQRVTTGASGTVRVADGGTLVITATAAPALYIDANGSFTSVGNITFLDSWEANRHGAAVYADAGAALSFNSGTVAFVNGFIYEIGQGGAIYAADSLAITASQSEIVFRDNQAYRGGAIFAEDSVSIDTAGSSLLFASNTAFAVDEVHSFLSAGGAVFTFNDLSINMTGGGTLAFLNNYAHEVGGAIASGTETNAPGDYAGGVSITGDYERIVMSGNVAFSSGGAIWSAGTVAISATSGALIITSNTSLDSTFGSAIHTSEGDITIGGSYGVIEIADNVTVASSWRGGGALSASSGDIVINPAATGTLSLVSNTSSVNGGALHTMEGDIMIGGSYGDVFINSNVASENGGAFYAEQGDVIIAGTHGGIFINSNTSANGGAFYASRGTVRFSATTAGELRIVDNYASNAGGVIIAHGGIVINGDYGSILINSNTAQSFASAIYTYNGSVVISATASGSLQIANNCALGSYGAIYAGNGFSITGEYDDVSITGNTSSSHSGAVFTSKNIVIAPDAETLAIADNAAQYGGAFYSSGTTVIGGGAKNISIAGNTASGIGGAIYAGSGFALNLAAGGVFTATNNMAANNASGGFLYTNSGSMLFDIGANASAAIGGTNSIAATTDSIAAGAGVSLTKTGAGALTLWANNTYTGTTFVNAGKLDLRGYVSSTHTLVASGATLAGTGTAGGHVTIQGGGHLSPGASPGQFTILGNLTLENNAQLDWELGARTDPGHMYHSGTNDLLIVGGNVTASGMSRVNITTTATLAKGEYDLINYAGALSGGHGNFAIGLVDGLVLTGTDLGKYRIVTSETNWIKLAYDLGGYAIWDGDNTSLWNNDEPNGGNGTWYAPGQLSGTHTAWTGTDAAVNGEWEQGEFAIFKGVSGTVTVVNSGTTIELSGAQFRTDGYLLTGGTLTTSGSDADIILNIDTLDYRSGAAVSTTIATQITGTHGVTKAGGEGTLVLSGSNTYAGPTQILSGTLVMTNEHAIGDNTATISTDATLRVATGSMTFSNTLTGEGLFEVDLASSSDAFSFSLQSFSPSALFSGTAKFLKSAFTLNNNALANADVILGANNTTTVATGTHAIGNLAIDGGTLVFTHATGTRADGIIRTGTLDAISGTVTVTSTYSGSTGLFAKPLLQQDEGYRVLLIDATALSNTSLTLAGGTTTTAAIKNTASVTTATATYAQTLDYTNGLSVAYELTQLDLLANQTTTLADDTEPPAGGSELHALITGAGNLQIDATSAITLNNAANTHTGTTLVNTGTLVSGTSNALGNTAWLAVTATAAYNLNGHTQTIANGAQIDGTLHGSGSLGLGGLATITSTNANFAANIGVTGTTIIASTQALGTTTGTIAIAANAALQTASATGAFTKTLAGSGAFELLGTSTITLAGDNTAYSGTFAISAASRLAASTNANLGNAALSGSGVFEKIDAATALTIDHANTTFTGTTLITGGTLRLENLQGVGTSAVINNAILDLAATGTFANNITGTGTSHVSSGSYGSYTVLTGTNSTDWNITGAAQVSSTTNLGAGNTHIDGELSLAATTAWAYSNTLTGTGTLAVNLSGSAFTFSPSAFSSSAFFEGVLALENTTYNLFHNTANESALANATLRTQAGSIINLGTNSVSGTMKINGLELIGGTINVHLQSPDTAHVLEVNELTVANADSVSFNLDTSLTPAGAPTTGNFLDQDSGTNSIQLVKAASLDEAGKQMNLLFNGAAPSNTGTTLIVGDGHGNTDIEATYNYAAFSSGSAHVTGSAHSNHIEGPGIYVDYLLTELKTNTNLVLDNAGATDTVLGAKITGTGNLTIQARDTQIFLSHSNAYTGTTTISSGTLIAAANDALGQTAHLLITGTAAYNLNGHTQTIANGAQIDGTLHGSGSLGLGGLATITSTNAAFAANVGVTGTTIINNTQALGNTGTIAIASGATLSADGATGDLSKTLAGQGGVSLVNSATITLTADNTNYSGTFAISATSRLAASTNANLGNAALSGSGVFEKINAATALTIDHANNTFTGTTLITGGTLRLENLQGVGTSAVINNANLDLAATGTFSNNITGTGTSHVTQGSYGSYTVLTGTNSTDWHITGAAQVSSTANLGAGATHIDGLLDIDSATAWLYTNALSGTGILKVDTNNNAFSFSPSVFQPFSPFRGVLELHSAAFDLSGTNTAVLTEATLQIDENAFVATGSGAQQIGNLTLTSGTLGFTLAASGTEAAGIIRTGTLAVHDTVLVIDTGALPGNTLPLLQQDEPHTITLVESTTLAAGGKTLITGTQLVDQLGNQITDATQLDIAQSGDIVASGTYDFAAVASNTGIHLSYELTALDLLAGKTTLLTGDIDDAILNGADELHAKVSGSGNLRVEAAGSITLNNTNTYTGTTTLATGTLIAGANEALGQTSFLVVEIPATYDLNGNTQTLANGGQIDGLLTGTGALTLSTGTLLVTSSNTGFTAQTNINAPATARITDIDALGSAAIELEGILIVDTTGTGALQNTLSGTGTLIKDNTGIVAINHSNAGFTGDASIDEGRLIAAKIDALGTAAITVADGAAFEQLNVTGTLQNELHGEGLHQLTNSTLTLANPAGYTIAATTLDATSALILETTGYRFRALELNNGALAFAATAPTAAAQIDTLGDTTGRFILNAKLADITAGINPAGTVANHLAIADAGAGRHDVYINPISEPPAAINFAIELITTGSGSATFAMANPGGKLEYDLTTIELVQGDGSVYTPDTNKWYLSDRNLSHAADAIINTASTLALDWAYALDALHLRLGDIRAETLTRSDNPKSGNLWIRARGYRLNAANDLSGMSFRQYGWGMTGGADKIFETETGVHLLGAFIDTGGVDRDFDNGGNGKTRNVAVGAYLTLLKQTGWHLDVVARLDRYSNEFEAKAVDGRTTRGKYTTGAQSLSAEFGRRLQRTDGWWVEPGVQVAVLSLDSANYSTQATADQRAIDVHVDSSKTWQYRALVRFGKQIPGSRWAPYGKFAAVSVESSDGEISAHGKTFEANYDGKRVEFGLGTSYRINDISQVYFDYEYAKAQFYERPWSLNLGYRRLW